MTRRTCPRCGSDRLADAQDQPTDPVVQHCRDCGHIIDTPRPDFGDLLIALADHLDEIRQCIGCGEPSTWVGLFLHDQGEVTVTAWCDAAACEHDRTVLSVDRVLAVPINHLPALRSKA